MKSALDASYDNLLSLDESILQFAGLTAITLNDKGSIEDITPALSEVQGWNASNCKDFNLTEHLLYQTIFQTDQFLILLVIIKPASFA